MFCFRPLPEGWYSRVCLEFPVCFEIYSWGTYSHIPVSSMVIMYTGPGTIHGGQTGRHPFRSGARSCIVRQGCSDMSGNWLVMYCTLALYCTVDLSYAVALCRALYICLHVRLCMHTHVDMCCAQVYVCVRRRGYVHVRVHASDPNAPRYHTGVWYVLLSLSSLFVINKHMPCLLRKPLPCSPAAETALQPLMWSSES